MSPHRPARAWAAALRALRLRFATDRALAARATDPRVGTAERGAIGEELAARHLTRAGLRLLGRRWRAASAEVDLLALARDGALIVVEVKAAVVPAALAADPRGLRFPPGAHLGPDQTRRLVYAARDEARRRRRPAWRVELVEVVCAPGRAPDLRRSLVADSAGPFPEAFRDR